jgi:DNA-binding protein YbaB
MGVDDDRRCGMDAFSNDDVGLGQVDAWLAATQAGAACSAAAARRLRELNAVGRDVDNNVQVWVSGSGVLIDIELDPRIRAQPVKQTRHQILAAIADAQRALTTQVAEIAAETWGDDSPTTVSLIAAHARLLGGPGVGDDVT